MRILLTGGSACGKSTYAEALAARFGRPLYYLATMRPFGEESERKIARHRAMRKEKGFITIERDTDIGGVTLLKRGTVLLECMCNLSANEMFDETGVIRDAFDTLVDGVEALSARCDTLIVVTNDVGSDGCGYSASTRRYVELLGRVNSELAARFDVVAELVCGIPVVIKGALP